MRCKPHFIERGSVIVKGKNHAGCGFQLRVTRPCNTGLFLICLGLLLSTELLDRFRVMGQQVLLGGAAEVFPRQDLGGVKLSLREGIEVYAGLGACGPPYLGVEDLVPQVEPGPGPPRGFDHVSASPVGPADRRFEDASIHIVELELQVLGPQALFLVEDQLPCLLEI